MSLYKQIWIDRDPAYEGYRREQMAEAWEEIAEFKFRIPRRRYRQHEGKKCLDRLWPISLSRAIRALEIDMRNVNDSILIRTQIDCDKVRNLAEKILRELGDQHQY